MHALLCAVESPESQADFTEFLHVLIFLGTMKNLECFFNVTTRILTLKFKFHVQMSSAVFAMEPSSVIQLASTWHKSFCLLLQSGAVNLKSMLFSQSSFPKNPVRVRIARLQPPDGGNTKILLLPMYFGKTTPVPVSLTVQFFKPHQRAEFYFQTVWYLQV